MIEKEERYKITEEQLKDVIENTKDYIKKTDMLDVSFYKNGQNLYDLYKYIIRIRTKNNKSTLEIKKYDNEDECIEGSIEINSVKDATNFLKLMGLEPFIYLKRCREVRKYKDLDIFIDEFDVIGTHMEIEYQDCSNAKEQIDEFKRICKINQNSEDMYGAIINDKLLTDGKFKEIYNQNMKEILNEY